MYYKLGPLKIYIKDIGSPLLISVDFDQETKDEKLKNDQTWTQAMLNRGRIVGIRHSYGVNRSAAAMNRSGSVDESCRHRRSIVGHRIDAGFSSRCAPILPSSFNRDESWWTVAKTITQTCPCNILQYFTAVKIVIFRWKNVIFFLFLFLHIDRGYTLEPPRWGGSNEYPQSMF